MSESRTRQGFLRAIVILFSLLFVAGVLLIWLRPRPKAPVRLTLPDGSTVSVAGVSFGTNHFYGGLLGRLIFHLPPVLQDLVPDLGSFAVYGAMKTPTPVLVVWLALPKASTSPPGSASSGGYVVYLADTNDFVSGPAQGLPSVGMAAVIPLQFSVFPRRDRMLALHVYFDDFQGGPKKDCGSLVMSNPACGAYPQWQPEALPATHRAGDVEATLESFSTGHGQGMSMRTLPGGKHEGVFGGRTDGLNYNGCVIHLRSLTDTNQVWMVDHVQISDATSNVLSNTGMNTMRMSSSEVSAEFSQGLWTNEMAWKLRYAIKRTKGFAPGELFTFKSVPLGDPFRTNQYGWTTNLNGVTVSLDYLVRRPPVGDRDYSTSNMSVARFTVSGTTNDLYLDLAEIRADNGTNVDSPAFGMSNTYQERYMRNIPLAAKSLDFTFAVHQGRSVEFLVKPVTGNAH